VCLAFVHALMGGQEIHGRFSDMLDELRGNARTASLWPRAGATLAPTISGSGPCGRDG
jgi:hypothetical protein